MVHPRVVRSSTQTDRQRSSKREVTKHRFVERQRSSAREETKLASLKRRRSSKVEETSARRSVQPCRVSNGGGVSSTNNTHKYSSNLLYYSYRYRPKIVGGMRRSPRAQTTSELGLSKRRNERRETLRCRSRSRSRSLIPLLLRWGGLVAHEG